MEVSFPRTFVLLDKGSSESCMPFSILGAKVLRYFRSRERKFQATKVPWNESSTHGTFAPGSESTWERKFQLPFLPLAVVKLSTLKTVRFWPNNTHVVIM